MENTTVRSGVSTVGYTVNFFFLFILFYSSDSYANECI